MLLKMTFWASQGNMINFFEVLGNDWQFCIHLSNFSEFCVPKMIVKMSWFLTELLKTKRWSLIWYTVWFDFIGQYQQLFWLLLLTFSNVFFITYHIFVVHANILLYFVTCLLLMFIPLCVHRGKAAFAIIHWPEIRGVVFIGTRCSSHNLDVTYTCTAYPMVHWGGIMFSVCPSLCACVACRGILWPASHRLLVCHFQGNCWSCIQLMDICDIYKCACSPSPTNEDTFVCVNVMFQLMLIWYDVDVV